MGTIILCVGRCHDQCGACPNYYHIITVTSALDTMSITFLRFLCIKQVVHQNLTVVPSPNLVANIKTRYKKVGIALLSL